MQVIYRFNYPNVFCRVLVTKKGSFTCTCTADFAGDSCDLELNACFTREEPCNDTGTTMCENLDPFTSNSPFECVCKPGHGILRQYIGMFRQVLNQNFSSSYEMFENS